MLDFKNIITFTIPSLTNFHPSRSTPIQQHLAKIHERGCITPWSSYSIIQPSASSQISSELEYVSVAHSNWLRPGKSSMSSSLYKKYPGEIRTTWIWTGTSREFLLALVKILFGGLCYLDNARIERRIDSLNNYFWPLCSLTTVKVGDVELASK